MFVRDDVGVRQENSARPAETGLLRLAIRHPARRRLALIGERGTRSI